MATFLAKAMDRDRKQILTEYLVLQAQDGNERGICELYSLWHHDLLRYARSRVQGETAAEEVAQEAWLHIAKGLSRLNDPACFPRWAYQIVFRRSADWVRRESRRRHRQNVLEREAEQVLPQQDASAFSPVTEQWDQVQIALSRMQQSERDVLELFYLSGLDIAAIADVLGIPCGTVKSRLFYAREHLRDAMLSGDLE
ncbi:MAG: sigma-70 family RNA polymerase sigma factor [Puniceicoccaceae bacterium]